MSQSYERSSKSAKFNNDPYSQNVQITRYYADSSRNDLVRIEERTVVDSNSIYMWAQTISGSGYSQQWPLYNNYVIEDPWTATTDSGSLL